MFEELGILVSGYRGSTSFKASQYKKDGHKNEELFGSYIGGTNEDLPPQGKTDWLDSSNKRYSVKRGLNRDSQGWTKHWQVFLYGLPRLKSDSGFADLGKLGALLVSTLEAFPEDADSYQDDKVKVKAVLEKLDRSIKGADRVEKVRAAVGAGNHYLAAKSRLSSATEKLLKEIEDLELRKDFLRKAFFNGTEVDFLVINENDRFIIYEREDVVKILAEALEPQVSKAGRRFDDLNVPGQKLLLKLKRNVGELEVRNEPSHYRELKLNFHAKTTAKLLKEKTTETKSANGLSWRTIGSP